MRHAGTRDQLQYDSLSRSASTVLSRALQVDTCHTTSPFFWKPRVLREASTTSSNSPIRRFRGVYNPNSRSCDRPPLRGQKTFRVLRHTKRKILEKWCSAGPPPAPPRCQETAKNRKRRKKSTTRRKERRAGCGGACRSRRGAREQTALWHCRLPTSRC